MIATWWPWAHSPQACWSPRIDNDNPCDSTLLSHHQPVRDCAWPGTPNPSLTFQNAFLKPFLEFEAFFSTTTCVAVFYNKHCTLLHQNPVSICTLLHQNPVPSALLHLGKWTQVWFSNRRTDLGSDVVANRTVGIRKSDIWTETRRMERFSLVVNLGKSTSDTGSDQGNNSKARARPVNPQELQGDHVWLEWSDNVCACDW